MSFTEKQRDNFNDNFVIIYRAANDTAKGSFSLQVMLLPPAQRVHHKRGSFTLFLFIAERQIKSSEHEFL